MCFLLSWGAQLKSFWGRGGECSLLGDAVFLWRSLLKLSLAS